MRFRAFLLFPARHRAPFTTAPQPQIFPIRADIVSGSKIANARRSSWANRSQTTQTPSTPRTFPRSMLPPPRPHAVLYRLCTASAIFSLRSLKSPPKGGGITTQEILSRLLGPFEIHQIDPMKLSRSLNNYSCHFNPKWRKFADNGRASRCFSHTEQTKRSLTHCTFHLCPSLLGPSHSFHIPSHVLDTTQGHSDTTQGHSDTTQGHSDTTQSSNARPFGAFHFKSVCLPIKAVDPSSSEMYRKPVWSDTSSNGREVRPNLVALGGPPMGVGMGGTGCDPKSGGRTLPVRAPRSHGPQVGRRRWAGWVVWAGRRPTWRSGWAACGGAGVRSAPPCPCSRVFPAPTALPQSAIGRPRIIAHKHASFPISPTNTWLAWSLFHTPSRFAPQMKYFCERRTSCGFTTIGMCVCVRACIRVRICVCKCQCVCVGGGWVCVFV